MSQPLLVTGTIGIDTILTPRNRAEGVLGGSVSFAAVAALRTARSPLWKPSLVLAAVIAFSRLYLYAHWPTDILGGILVGTLAGWLGAKLVQLLAKKGEKN